MVKRKRGRLDATTALLRLVKRLTTFKRRGWVYLRWPHVWSIAIVLRRHLRIRHRHLWHLWSAWHRVRESRTSRAAMRGIRVGSHRARLALELRTKVPARLIGRPSVVWSGRVAHLPMLRVRLSISPASPSLRRVAATTRTGTGTRSHAGIADIAVRRLRRFTSEMNGLSARSVWTLRRHGDGTHLPLYQIMLAWALARIDPADLRCHHSTLPPDFQSSWRWPVPEVQTADGRRLQEAVEWGTATSVAK